MAAGNRGLVCLCHEKVAVVVPADATDGVSTSEKDYNLDDDYDLMTMLLAERGLVAKPLQ
jgi:hypothetical protein